MASTVSNIMGVMNRHVPGEKGNKKDEASYNLWDALRNIVENENGEHEEEPEYEYDDFDRSDYNFYRNLQVTPPDG